MYECGKNSRVEGGAQRAEGTEEVYDFELPKMGSGEYHVDTHPRPASPVPRSPSESHVPADGQPAIRRAEEQLAPTVAVAVRPFVAMQSLA